MFIVVEGIDGSGKQTQVDLLVSAMPEYTKKSFPNYNSESSKLVKMYLNGGFGMEAQHINPYAAASCYAIDRFLNIPTTQNVIFDRYVTSNMIYQACKLKGTARAEFLNWINDFEYDKLKIPRPDVVFFLNTPPKITSELLGNRNKKFDGKDIHEGNLEFMQNCYECGMECAERFGWQIINCINAEGNLKTPEEIHSIIMNAIKDSNFQKTII